MATFNIDSFRNGDAVRNQYQLQLDRLSQTGKQTTCIEKAVQRSIANLSPRKRSSFIIYGEPQSGKTEMMICLTAKLLDEGHKFILHLLNDSVDLLGQNLGRFQESGIAPAAKHYTDILDPSVKIRGMRHVIFSKKNARDLEKLHDKIGALENIIVIDDEADFASPNSKINKQEKTRINELIANLLGDSGIYIGVTATPARLDLNNTFDNDNKIWVDFPPHNHYTGQDIFFPLDQSKSDQFQLTLLPDAGDDPKYLRRSFFSFLVNVAHLNIVSKADEANYSMLIHTSGKKADHRKDKEQVDALISILLDDAHPKYAAYVKEIWEISASRYLDADPNEITSYVVSNISRNAVILINSDRDFIQHGKSATNPSALFTIIVGGNIISRGVTFDNLLSMFFTRDVKHKIQQDTYIQRARMFGARGKYLSYFELTIPEALYIDWHRCFVFHKLALDAIREGMGSPVWLSDHRISAVASSSIDQSTVDLDRGEMSFGLFKYDATVEALIVSPTSVSTKLDTLHEALGHIAFPSYLKRFISRTSDSIETRVAIHGSSSIGGYTDREGLDKTRIERKKGFFGKTQLEREKFPDALHHLKIFYNDDGYGRLFYKFDGSIQFIKNLRFQ